MLTTIQRRKVILISIAILLSIPLIAMQFSKDVNWSLFDFIVVGGLLLIVGFLLELILSHVKSGRMRPILIISLIVLFLLTWIELAVGIFGTPFAGS